METQTFTYFLYGWIILALVLVPVQLRITAPYGRHVQDHWGFQMPYRVGWIMMEMVSPLTFMWFYFSGENEKTPVHWIIFALWAGHYFHRSLIYPLRAKMSGKKIPVAIVGSAAFFNLVNGSANGYFLGSFAAGDGLPAIDSLIFLVGLAIFLTGAGINIWSDNALIKLRKPGETGYKIPEKGLFRWISCPNHFGEIIEWIGFAILCANLAALSFAVWTAANLIPRAISHHRWYHAQFENYPTKRKAVIPFLL